MVKVTALDVPGTNQIRRFGFLAGEISIPEDFDTMGSQQIEALFGNGP